MARFAWFNLVLGAFAALPLSSGEGEITVELPGGAMVEFVWIEPGTFAMGSTDDQEQLLRDKGMWNEVFKDEHPSREVTISQGFYLGKYEITQGQWERVMGSQPWSGLQLVQANPDHPAVYITREDVQAFIRTSNEAAGEELYRLPTEAEWEYACRAGTTTLWSFGDDENQLQDYAWYEASAWSAGLEYAQPVGTRKPNPWGLYDMHGNVFEWVLDWYGANYYGRAPGTDPTGPAAGFGYVMRGGCFGADARDVRSASRIWKPPGTHTYAIGARLLRVGPEIRSPVPPESWGRIKSDFR